MLSACQSRHVASNPEILFAAARNAYQHGDFARAREYAGAGYSRFKKQARSEWYWKFKLLYAEMQLWNGNTEAAESLLPEPPPVIYPKLGPRYQMLRGYVLFRKQRMDDADKLLLRAYQTSQEQAQYELASDIQSLRAYFLTDATHAEEACHDALRIAINHHLLYQQAVAHLNCGVIRIDRSHFGSAIPELKEASQIARSIGASMLNSLAIGDIATCYYNLGDFTQALRTDLDLLPMQKEAGLSTILRDSYLQIGKIYLLQRENEKAVEYFRQAIALARKGDSPTAFSYVSAGIAQALASSGALDEAERYNREGLDACNKNDNGQLAALTLNEALIAARRSEHQQAAAQYAEAIRLGAEDPPILWHAYSGLALEEAALGDRSAANRNFEQALNVIEQNRSEQLVTDYKITFLSQLIRFYQEYVALLISEGESDRALEIADSSRAGVLTEDLLGQSAIHRSGLAGEIRRAAKDSNTTFLYYWLAPRRSYLWVIGPRDSRLLPLPGEEQIDRDVESYRHFLEQEKRDPLDPVNAVGERLFNSLVAPASVPKGSKVVIVPDGSLHNLNFETLPVYGGPLAGARGSVQSPLPSGRGSVLEMRADRAVPKQRAPIAYAQGSVSKNNHESNLGTSAETAATSRRATPASYELFQSAGGGPARPLPKALKRTSSARFGRGSEPTQAKAPAPHYWLEDATVSIAPSLSVLSTAPEHMSTTRSLLLIGNTLTQGTGFAPLPQSALEIEQIKKEFASDHVTAYTGASATAAAYRASHPERFSNIHFATHADANEQRPLDSAIILSPQQNTWKLYARDVADIPLHADLVTISACQGAGARTLSGEGLVGFAWAFFQAGARNVVTSLWDVNDRSTAGLMDSFYGDIARGKPYPDALRDAKLQMLNGQYRKPYYWGAFQLYSRYLDTKRHGRPIPTESAATAVHH